METNTFPHRRYNPLQDKWILVSPQRLNRPWNGQMEKVKEPTLPAYDPTCYLCPGNKRSQGQQNSDYKDVYHFVNDYSALLPQTPTDRRDGSLFRQQNETGVCEVICYSPSHNRPMACMNLNEAEQVVALWIDRYKELSKKEHINHVQIFENRGNEVGNSNPHPHGQIWAQRHIPNLASKEIRLQKAYFKKTNNTLLLDYLRQELKTGERIVYQNTHFTVLVPFWAEWPYETIILPRAKLPALDEMKAGQIAGLAKALSVISKTYAKLFNRPKLGAPYTMGIHQRPTDGKKHPGAQLHLHFQPPLLTVTRQKFMVGFERFAQPQRDITAEQAAAELKRIAAKIKI